MLFCIIRGFAEQEILHPKAEKLPGRTTIKRFAIELHPRLAAKHLRSEIKSARILEMMNPGLMEEIE